MVPKRGPKWTQNRGPFGEPRCSETQGIQRVLELFGLSEGSSFGLIWDTFWAQFRDPRISELFRFLIEVLELFVKLIFISGLISQGKLIFPENGKMVYG